VEGKFKIYYEKSAKKLVNFYKELHPQLLKLCEESDFLYETIDHLVEEKEKLADELFKLKLEYNLLQKENNIIKSNNIQEIEDIKYKSQDEINERKTVKRTKKENENSFINDPNSNSNSNSSIKMENSIFCQIKSQPIEESINYRKPDNKKEYSFQIDNKLVKENFDSNLNLNLNLKGKNTLVQDYERLNIFNSQLQKEINLLKCEINNLQKGFINKEGNRTINKNDILNNENEQKILLKEILNINKEQLSEIKALKENISKNIISQNKSSMGLILEETIKNLDCKINFFSRYESKLICNALKE